MGVRLVRGQQAPAAPPLGEAGLRADALILPPMMGANAALRDAASLQKEARLPPIMGSVASQSAPAFRWA